MLEVAFTMAFISLITVSIFVGGKVRLRRKIKGIFDHAAANRAIKWHKKIESLQDGAQKYEEIEKLNEFILNLEEKPIAISTNKNKEVELRVF